ncbi:hypothetical protein V6R21_32325 [Limibacter armeniacum]|uniref:hypothetical protein n=1 Tax=Limibacter armeniacum TaxID=466084 RepID=UPI002FE63CE0
MYGQLNLFMMERNINYTAIIGFICLICVMVLLLLPAIIDFNKDIKDTVAGKSYKWQEEYALDSLD